MKRALRTEMKNIISKIANKRLQSEIVGRKVIETIHFKAARKIGIYCSMVDEIDTDMIIRESFRLKKSVYVPKCLNGKMDFVRISFDEYETLEVGQMGIREPKGSETSSLDLLIVPGLAFTKSGNRLGRGKGYYDKYLQQNQVYSIGICFTEQLLEHLPLEAHDRRVSQIICP